MRLVEDEPPKYTTLETIKRAVAAKALSVKARTSRMTAKSGKGTVNKP